MSSSFPTSVDNPTQLVDGSDKMEAANVNTAYDALTSVQTMVGASGAAQSQNVDFLTYLKYNQAPILQYGGTNNFDVLPGDIVISNSGGSIKKLRRNTASVNVTASNLDTGAMAAGYYYVYAVADANATTFTVTFSTSSSAPTGATCYELIGWFYNETSSVLDITNKQFGNVKLNGRDVPNSVVITGTTDITTTSASYTDMTTMSRRFYTSGRPLNITFKAPIDNIGSATKAAVRIAIDGTEKIATIIGGSGTVWQSALEWEDTLAAGTYTIDVDWYRVAGSDTLQQNGTTYKRILRVTEK